MASARLEHLNVTVSNPAETAARLDRLFGWTTRWKGESIHGGETYHVGETDTYLAIYKKGDGQNRAGNTYEEIGGLNHIGIVVDDLDSTEDRVKAEGLIPKSHADYEPGRRFYFDDPDGIEFEVVSYDDK